MFFKHYRELLGGAEVVIVPTFTAEPHRMVRRRHRSLNRIRLQPRWACESNLGQGSEDFDCQ